MKGKINASIKYISKSVEETYALAKSIADKLKGGEVILLNGDLGAGKTTFTKGLAKALEVDDVVTSPTFTFMKEYLGRLPRRFHPQSFYRQPEICRIPAPSHKCL